MLTIGRSSIGQLINRAKNINEYNNHAVQNNSVWVDFFNEALGSMVEELDIRDDSTIEFVKGTKQYDLPEDYFSVVEIIDDQDQYVRPFKDNGINIDGERTLRPGYKIENKGSKYIIEFPHIEPPRTLTIEYVRYPALLTINDLNVKPEIPTANEMALCYKAVHFALSNNNQIGQAQYYNELFTQEMQRVDRVSFKARGL